MARSPQFEWTVVEQEAEWAVLSAAPIPPPPHTHWRGWHSPWFRALASLLLLSVSSGVYALERTAQAGWNEIETELHDVMAADAWTAQPRLSAQVPDVQVVQAEVHGPQAVVQAVVTQTLASGEQVAYQTTDFYTASAAGWVRTAPTPDQLGPVQTLATTYFEIRFHAVDAAVVRAIGPRLDALYTQLCAHFGLPPELLAQPIAVELVMDSQEPMGWVLHSSRRHAFQTPSPVLLQLPAEKPADEWIYQSIVEPLVYQAISRAAPQPRPNWPERRWDSLRHALALWQVWQADGALAAEREEVIRQFHGVAPTPAAFAACRAPLLWQTTATSAVKLCSELATAAKAVQATGAAARPPRLLGMLGMDADGFGETRPWGEMVALETLVEYAVERYGVERLPALLQATAKYSSWDGLIHATYDVSAEEFEQGWQAYVAEQYGLQPSR